MNNYILKGIYKGKHDNCEYFSISNNLYEIAEEAEECYKDQDIEITSAFIECPVTGEQTGGKDLLNAFYEILETDKENCCNKIYLVMEIGEKLKFNRYKGYRYYVLQGDDLSDAIMNFNDDLTHGDYITDCSESLILIDTIHC